MKSLFIVIFLFISVVINAQIVIEGTIKNQENEPLSYSAIGIKDTKIGSIANEKGFYKLTIPLDMSNKTIVFTADGYLPKEMIVSDLIQNGTINLNHKVETLSEVIITQKKLEEKIIGQTSRPFLTFSKMFDKNVPTIEQGNLFEIYTKTKINAYSFHIIPSSKYEQITLKLNIYDVKNGQPNKSILQENILYKTTTTGWQKIDLTKYKLLFKNIDKIAITVQLVAYNPLPNEDFIFGISAKKTLSKKLIFRYQSQSDWENSDGTFLSNIAISYNKKGNNEPQTKEPISEITSKEKELISFYKGREEGLKTSYGKNPNGKFLELPDAKIYYEEYGTGEPLILLEGNSGIISDFYNQIPFLAKKYRVIVLDTRNQGKSLDYSKENYGYEKLSDDLLKIVTLLKLDKVKIVGWSDGGITGLIFNFKNPNYVDKLIAIGANLNPQGVNEEFLDDIKESFKTTTDEKLRRRLNLLINHPDITSENLNGITNPVLIIAGDSDVIKEEHTIEIANSIKNSKLQIIKNCSHNVPFDQPKVLNDLILNFL
jgi:pimeloyl-ACP methyl ester carboxylesterase